MTQNYNRQIQYLTCYIPYPYGKLLGRENDVKGPHGNGDTLGAPLISPQAPKNLYIKLRNKNISISFYNFNAHFIFHTREEHLHSTSGQVLTLDSVLIMHATVRHHNLA